MPTPWLDYNERKEVARSIPRPSAKDTVGSGFDKRRGENAKSQTVGNWWRRVEPWQDEYDKWLMSDTSSAGMTQKYKEFLFDQQNEQWTGDRPYQEAEKRGILQWLARKDAEYSTLNNPGSSSRGYGGGGGGGGIGRGSEIDAASAAIRNQLGLLGIPMSDDAIKSLASKAVNKRWSADQLTDTILEAVDWATTTNGQLKAGVNEIKALGSQYLIPVSDETARSMSVRVASGELDQAGIRSLFVEQARSQYGFLAEQLDQGITPADFFAPLRDVAANTLELPADQLDLMDSKVRSMFTVTNADGTMRSATLTEAEMNARRDERYKQTNGARDRMAAMGSALSRAFGGKS